MFDAAAVVASRTAAVHSCKCAFMSRPGSPRPCYDHPGLQTEPGASVLLVSEVAVPCMLPVMVPYPVAPLMPGLSPREVGAFVHHQAATPTAPLAEELQAFVGWVLELLVLPPATTQQLRNHPQPIANLAAPTAMDYHWMQVELDRGFCIVWAPILRAAYTSLDRPSQADKGRAKKVA